MDSWKIHSEITCGETVSLGERQYKTKNDIIIQTMSIKNEDVEPADVVPRLSRRFKHLTPGTPFFIEGRPHIKATKSTAISLADKTVIEVKKKRVVEVAILDITASPVDVDYFWDCQGRAEAQDSQEEIESDVDPDDVDPDEERDSRGVYWSRIVERANTIVSEAKRLSSRKKFNREAEFERALSSVWTNELTRAAGLIRLIVSQEDIRPGADPNRAYASNYGIPEYIAASCGEIIEVGSLGERLNSETFPFKHGEKDADGLEVVFLAKLRKSVSDDPSGFGLAKAANALYKKCRRQQTGYHLILNIASVVYPGSSKVEDRHGLTRSLLFTARRISVVVDEKIIQSICDKRIKVIKREF